LAKVGCRFTCRSTLTALLWGKEAATAEELCSKMQRKREFAERILEDMSKKGMIETAQCC
jgi:predicted transcriptional regulator